MLFSDPTPVGPAILAGALLTSLLLGVLLGTYKGHLSDTTRLGILLVLAFAVGFTIYIWIFLLPVSLAGYVDPFWFQNVVPLLTFVIISSLICGGVSMICPNTKQE
jgi:hypothetical protein